MLVLPQVQPTQFDYYNSLFFKNRSIGFHLLGKEYEVHFSPPSGQLKASLSLEFQIGEAASPDRFWLRLVKSPALSILSDSLESVSLNKLPPDIGLIVVNMILDEQLKVLEAKVGNKIKVINIQMGEPVYVIPDHHREKLDFKVYSNDNNSLWLEGSWIASHHIFEKFLNLIYAIPLQSLHSFDYIPIYIHFEIGHIIISSREYKNLGLYDIILLDNPHILKEKTITGKLTNRSLKFKAKFDATQITIMTQLSRDKNEFNLKNIPSFGKGDEEEHHEDEDFDMDEHDDDFFDDDDDEDHDEHDEYDDHDEEHHEEEHHDDATEKEDHHTDKSAVKRKADEEEDDDDTASPVDVGSFDIDLTFEVGYTSIPLRDLKTLKPGYVFNLEKPLAESVEIVAEGEVIGRGELVQIEDKIGVRVLKFF